MRLNSLKSTLDEYKGWLVLLGSAYLLYCFRGLFTALGNTAGSLAESATANVAAAAQASADKKKVAASTGTKSPITDADVATWKADATTVAHMLGHDSFGLSTLFKDRAGAFALLKSRYSRLLFKNNKPYYIATDGKGKKTYPQTSAETPHSVKRANSYKVLVPFYKEVTSGRDLLADLRSDLDIPEFRPFIGWIL